VVVHLGADVFRQVTELVVGGAARMRRAAAAGRSFAAGIDRIDNWQIH
jgi:hypothetical protein